MTVSVPSDRYASFRGIDCEGNARIVIDRILALVEDPANDSVLWQRFRVRLAEAGKLGARLADELCLACSHTYYIEELFEAADDQDGLAALRRLEDECC
ncbi:nitrogen fixation protein CowN [Paramagnetospirillum marisnigri]|uniref:N(2)-fixation sustaining protein CowN n=1 Tax=Paramagnetospirillum marisnigri TaxID=1285242 RepID=A0A178MJI0_9PROT|nr:N(2)-fixation sustaining protein CowN [Paramagnetospirillum marisnigri]OAN48205.1 nitrogen fixation protein CowN [Paramagnetospirillum marisnigri]